MSTLRNSPSRFVIISPRGLDVRVIELNIDITSFSKCLLTFPGRLGIGLGNKKLKLDFLFFKIYGLKSTHEFISDIMNRKKGMRNGMQRENGLKMELRQQIRGFSVRINTLFLKKLVYMSISNFFGQNHPRNSHPQKKLQNAPDKRYVAIFE